MVKAMKNKTKKSLLLVIIGIVTLTVCILLGAITAQAKTITITDPEDMKNINWKNAGFGPGNTYKLGADMTLGENDDSTVALTKGNFVIDLNGHTLQNATQNLTVIHVAGANVTLKDSKVSSSKPSIRSYGARFTRQLDLVRNRPGRRRAKTIDRIRRNVYFLPDTQNRGAPGHLKKSERSEAGRGLRSAAAGDDGCRARSI